MSGGGPLKSVPPVVPVARRFRAFDQGEIVRGEFKGDPIVSVYGSTSKKGGLTLLNGARIESELGQWWSEAEKAFPEGKAALQVKAIALKSDEAKLLAAFAKIGVTPMAMALFNEGEWQEVFFFADAGRLRVAPLQIAEASRAPEKKPELARVETSHAKRSASDSKFESKPAAKSYSGSSANESKPTSAYEPPKPARKARVLIVDDSKTMRVLLRKIIDASPDLETVGEAERPSQVEGLIAQLKPDVMTLDINMPEMTGVELLRRLLPKQFIPTVMISSLSIDEGKEVLTALELGAVDYIHKPAANEMATVVPIIQEKIAEASRVRKRAAQSHAARPPSARMSGGFASSKLIAVGASTGGTEAIKSVFTEFPSEIPPIAVVQHIPPYFSTAFANRLNELCAFEVREAKDGDEFLPGLALIAPGGLHMEVVREGQRLIARVFDGDPVNRFKPSVDVLFRSVAKQLGNKATGVLMTGMGSDGAKGLLEMKNAGAFTIAQDQESCVVFGMPRAAIEIGAHCEIKSLEEISGALMRVKAA